MSEAYPLYWPEGWPRTPGHKREKSRFGPGGLAKEIQFLQWEVQRLGGSHIVISTNVALRRDGLPYSGAKKPDDPGVAVYFLLRGKQQCIPCDRWATVEENCRAIWKSIEAMRGLARWGAKSFVDAAFKGFEALPAPMHWSDVLQVPRDADLGSIHSAYVRLAKERHPDCGGSDAAMAEINDAYAQARQEASSRT